MDSWREMLDYIVADAEGSDCTYCRRQVMRMAQRLTAAGADIDLLLVPRAGVRPIAAYFAAVLRFCDASADVGSKLVCFALNPMVRLLLKWSAKQRSSDPAGAAWKQTREACRVLSIVSHEPTVLGLKEYLLMVQDQLEQASALEASDQVNVHAPTSSRAFPDKQLPRYRQELACERLTLAYELLAHRDDASIVASHLIERLLSLVEKSSRCEMLRREVEKHFHKTAPPSLVTSLAPPPVVAAALDALPLRAPLPSPAKAPRLTSPEHPKSRQQLYISQLPFACTTEMLYEVFSKYGDISDCFVACRDGRSRGFGYVTFARQSCGAQAMLQMHGTELIVEGGEGRAINVTFARLRPGTVPEEVGKVKEARAGRSTLHSSPVDLRDSLKSKRKIEVVLPTESEEDASPRLSETHRSVKRKADTIGAPDDVQTPPLPRCTLTGSRQVAIQPKPADVDTCHGTEALAARHAEDAMDAAIEVFRKEAGKRGSKVQALLGVLRALIASDGMRAKAVRSDKIWRSCLGCTLQGQAPEVLAALRGGYGSLGAFMDQYHAQLPIKYPLPKAVAIADIAVEASGMEASGMDATAVSSTTVVDATAAATPSLTPDRGNVSVPTMEALAALDCSSGVGRQVATHTQLAAQAGVGATVGVATAGIEGSARIEGSTAVVATAVDEAVKAVRQEAAAEATRAGAKHAVAIKHAVLMAKQETMQSCEAIIQQETVQSCEAIIQQAVEATIARKAAESTATTAQARAADAEQRAAEACRRLEDVTEQARKAKCWHDEARAKQAAATVVAQQHAVAEAESALRAVGVVEAQEAACLAEAEKAEFAARSVREAVAACEERVALKARESQREALKRQDVAVAAAVQRMQLSQSRVLASQDSHGQQGSHGQQDPSSARHDRPTAGVPPPPPKHMSAETHNAILELERCKWQAQQDEAIRSAVCKAVAAAQVTNTAAVDKAHAASKQHMVALRADMAQNVESQKLKLEMQRDRAIKDARRAAETKVSEEVERIVSVRIRANEESVASRIALRVEAAAAAMQLRTSRQLAAEKELHTAEIERIRTEAERNTDEAIARTRADVEASQPTNEYHHSKACSLAADTRSSEEKLTRSLMAFRQYVDFKREAVQAAKKSNAGKIANKPWPFLVHREPCTLVSDVLVAFGKLSHSMRSRLFSTSVVTFVDVWGEEEEGVDEGGLTAEMV